MHRYFSSLACIILLVGNACEQKTEITLPPDKVLIDLLFDLHLAEASMTRVSAEKQDSVSDVVRTRVAGSYGITPAEMDVWIEILQKSPDHLIVVYDSVIARLEKVKTSQE